ncbi:uncharacterized protein LOC143766645 isoform X4 [Ranitomeya variabilis]|uniref:uncharacterized protein LOC143766645 isoform X4 n=1 Tax=Ranitomeya variabilis TaxID=490064 RepID=UPI00405675B1
MDMDRDKMAERILHLTLEILFRLTGEDYIVVKTSSERCQDPVSEGWGRPLSPITGSPPHPLIHEDINDQKILELTYKMIELLTGEVPIRCQDVTVYFSMEEWEYLEGHRDLYKDVMMEVSQPLKSPDLSSKRTTPERCPRPLLPQDCKQEDPNVPQDHQGEDLTHINTTETYVRGDERCKEKTSTSDSPDDCTRRSEGQLTSSVCKSVDLEITQDTTEVNVITPDIPSSLHSKDLSSDQLKQVCLKDRKIQHISRMTSTRHFEQLFCKMCKTLQRKLSRHLCKSCMKTASVAEHNKVLEEAKRKRRNIIKYLSAVSYDSLDFKKSKFEDPKEFFADFLERRGCTVLNKPSNRIADCEVTGISGETSQLHLRKHLSEAGLQQKHDLASPTLTRFKEYLQKTHSEMSVERMVDNVARFLYYVSPEEITLDFLKEFDKTMAYFDTLSKLKTAEQTLKKYIGNVRQLVFFLTGDLDEETKIHAKSFLEGLKKIEQGVNEKKPKSLKRGLGTLPLTNPECCKILQASKKNVTTIFEKARSDQIISDTDKAIVGYYLMAILILRHRRRPSVPKKLTVKEWLQRKQVQDRDERSFAAVYTGRDVVIMDSDEEHLFSTYFEKIRPTLQKLQSTTVQQFFLSLTGQEVKNPTKDLERFHNKFNLPLVTWKMATSAYEHWADEMSQDSRSLTDNYVYYGDLKDQIFTPDLVEGMKKLMKMKENEEGETSGNVSKRMRTSSQGPSREGQSDEGESGSEESEGPRHFLYQRLMDRCPVGINTSPPSMKLCKEVNLKHAKFLRNKWIGIQKRLRVEDAAESFRKSPSRKQLSNYVKGQGWNTNIPTIVEVTRAWKPPMQRKPNDFPEEIKALVRTQKWKGLVIIEDSSKGGHTVKTTHAFKKGEVVCDYHGKLMSSKKGEELQRSLTGMSYIYFFEHKGQKFCINATNVPCDCHPDMPSTFGRMINHLGIVDNLKPKVLDCGDGETPTILFFAKRDLKPGTELSFD